jgi:DNA-binding NarL/FixJ family response regulator
MVAKRTTASRKNHGSGKRSSAVSNGRQRSKKGSVRVVIADDEPVILDQIGMLLETDFDVVGRACNGRELVETAQRLSPSIVVADITMPEMNGIEATRRITKTNPKVKVVMLSVHSEQAIVEAAFAAGASGYVAKLYASTELIPAIKKVLGGRRYRPRALRSSRSPH